MTAAPRASSMRSSGDRPTAAGAAAAASSSRPAAHNAKTRATASGGSAQVRDLTAQNTELRLQVERTEQEREFYFEKLQDIEFLCQRPEFADQTLTKVVERILYFTEGKPDIEAIIADCSAQRETDVAGDQAAAVEEEAVPAAPAPEAERRLVEEEEEEVFADAEAGKEAGIDLDTTVEADVETTDVSMTAASPLLAPAKSPAQQPRSPLASQPVNVKTY